MEDAHFANCILNIENKIVPIENDVNTIRITEEILKQIRETW